MKMLTLEQLVWRLFVGYHMITFVVFAYYDCLFAWGVTVLLEGGLTVGFLYYERRTCKHH